MHAYFLSVLIEVLGERGHPPQALFDGTGVSADDIAAPRGLPAEQLNALFSRAQTLVQDPLFGLKLGSRINIVSQGIFGYALMTSATVEDAIKLLIRYNRSLVPNLRLRFEVAAGRAWIKAEGENVPRSLARLFCEIVFAAIIRNGGILIGNISTTIRLDLDYQPLGSPSAWQMTFGTDVNFDAPHCAVSFDEASLAIPISTANPSAGDIFRRECDRLVSRSELGGTTNERVQETLLQSGSDFPPAAEIAKRLNMSESTLQRRLKKEGWRYQELLDKVRYTLAMEYLETTTLPVAEIALLLGFSDSPNFRRSFRRWSGFNPSDIRDRISAV